MMIKHQDVVLHLLKLGRDALAAKTPGGTHLDDPSLDMFSEDDILRMIQAADVLFKNDGNPALFHETSFHKLANDIHDGPHVQQLEQHEENFPTFAVFLETMIQQTKIMFHITMSLFITSMRPYDYNEKVKLRKREEETERGRSVSC